MVPSAQVTPPGPGPIVVAPTYPICQSGYRGLATTPLAEPTWDLRCAPPPESPETAAIPPPLPPFDPNTECPSPSASACTSRQWVESACGNVWLSAQPHACDPWEAEMRAIAAATNGPTREIVGRRLGPGGAGGDNMRADHQLSQVAAQRFNLRVTPAVNSYRSQVDAIVAPAAMLNASADSVSGTYTCGGRTHADAAIGLWECDGNRMKTCAEFVHHAFYDVSHPSFLARVFGGNGRALFNALYSPVAASSTFPALVIAPRSALGTRGICNNDNTPRSRDNVALALPSTFAGGRVLTNPFWVQPRNNLGALAAGTSLLTRWNANREWCASRPDHARCRGEDLTWQWHFNRSRELRTMTRIGPDGGVAHTPRVSGDPAHPCGGVRTQGYTDEELNYLRRLGARYLTLLNELKGWREPVLEDGTPGFLDRLNLPRPADFTALQGSVLTRIGGGLGGGLGGGTFFAGPTGVPGVAPVSLEASVVTQLSQIADEADAWGCFSAGPSPCDWSPDFFAENVASDRYVTEEEAAYQQCVGFVESPGDFRAARPPPVGGSGSAPNREYTWSSRSPAAARFHVTMDVPGSAPGATTSWRPYSWNFNFVFPTLSPASSGPSAMWSGVPADPRVPFAGVINGTLLGNLDRVNSLPPQAGLLGYPGSIFGPGFVAPLCARTSFFDNSYCYNEFSKAGIARRYTAVIGSQAPELVGADGRLHLPARRFLRHEQLGNDIIGLAYTVSSSYAVTGGGPAGNSDPSNPQFGFTGSNRIGAHASTGLQATLHSLGQAADVVDLKVDADLQNGASGSVELLGQQVFAQSGADFTFTASSTATLLNVVTDIMVGIVPVRVTIRAVGTAGFSAAASASAPTDGGWQLNLPQDGSLHANVEPYASIEAFPTAAVSIAGFVDLVGIKGRLNVLSVNLPTVATIDLDGAELRATASSQIRLSALNGSISAFAEVGLFPITKTFEQPVLSWPGVTLASELFRSEIPGVRIADMRRAPWYP